MTQVTPVALAGPGVTSGLPTADPPRCLVMGVLNVTPDSFSDGGRYAEADGAIAHGLRLRAAGADLVDVGGESTRPGADRVAEADELARVLPVVTGLTAQRVAVSVDTMRASVATAAVAAGAVLVNDVSGGRADPDMHRRIAELDVGYVLMHWRAHSGEMQQHTAYDDVVGEVTDELRQQLGAAYAAGIAPERIAVDPGIGFSKTAEQNWTLLAGLDALHTLGHPVLVGTSRKGFLGELLGAQGTPRPAPQRDDATVATTALAAAAGAWCVRVHEVTANADAVRVSARWGAG